MIKQEKKFHEKVGSPQSVVANMLNCDIIVSESNLQLPYYVHFWTNALGKG